MKPAAKPQAKIKEPQPEAPRPTITLENAMLTGPDTSAFSGWGPKVAGAGIVLKSWN